MAIELIREPLKINRVIGEEMLQFSVQGDLIIPDTKPDLIGVLCITSDAIVNEVEVMNDRAVINGGVNFNIIYNAKDEERKLRSLNASVSFKETVEIQGVSQGMDATVNCLVMNTDYEILNERKIVVEAVVSINPIVSEKQELEIIEDIAENEKVQKLEKRFNVLNYIGKSQEKCNIREEVDLSSDMPEVFEILWTDTVIEKEVKFTDNKAIIRGEVKLNSFYIADESEKAVCQVESKLPFSQFVDLYGMDERCKCDVEVLLQDVLVTVEQNDEGKMKKLNYKVVLDITLEAFSEQERIMIEDLYSPDENLEIEYEEFSNVHAGETLSNEVKIKEKIELPGENQVQKLYSTFCKPVIIDVEKDSNKVSVKGVLEVSFLYHVESQDNPSVYKTEIPFTTVFMVEKDNLSTIYKATGCLEGCVSNLENNDEVEISAVIHVELKSKKSSGYVIIKKIEPSEDLFDENKFAPSIIIYFVQSGDTLWKIGKKFHAPLSDLIRVNHITDPDALIIGQQILIPKKQPKKNYLKR